MPSFVRPREVSWRRLLAAGLLAALAAAAAGGALELRQFGAGPASAAARLEHEVRTRFADMAVVLARAASAIADDPEAARALAAGPDGARRLFDLVERAARESGARQNELAITVYDAERLARAWIGRPSDLPGDRAVGPHSFFVTPAPLGFRLVHVDPIVDGGRRLGAVAVEHTLSPSPGAARISSGEFTLPTRLAPASLRMRYEGAGDVARSGAFLLYAPTGEPLVEVSVAEADLLTARATWRRGVVAVVLGILGATALLLIGPLLDRRAGIHHTGAYLRLSTAAALLVLLAAGAFWLAATVHLQTPPPVPMLALVAGGAATAMAALAASPVARYRLVRRARRVAAADTRWRMPVHLGAGALLLILFALLEVGLQGAVARVGFDLRHFSLFPWSGGRVLLLAGLFALHVAALWVGTLVLTAALAHWGPARARGRGRLLLLLVWMLPAAVAAALAEMYGWPLSSTALLLAVAACGVAALAAGRLVAWYRHATVAARITALFAAFLIPALLLYPAADFFAERAKRDLVVTQFAVQAQHHPQALQDRLAEARREIDAMPFLPQLVDELEPGDQPGTDSAFLVWSQTALARARLTSSVELFDRHGELVSRFALNVPEYTGAVPSPQDVAGCDWDVFGEAAPIFSEERRLLHAERRICVTGPGGLAEPVGTIVVHVVFDYRTLPFITSQSPYFELFQPEDRRPIGEDIEIVIYGWSQRPLFASGTAAWPLDDDLFARVYASRDPFWATVPRNGETFHVYFSNDRSGIYAIGYPAVTLFDRLVHLAELTTLAGLFYVLALIGTGGFARLSRSTPRIGRALLREVRASFYRKLFLAFVLASVLPVLTLALVIRAYFADLLRDGVQAEAARTAAVAQRVIEGSDALMRREGEAVAPLNDDAMVWISQVIDQDVNIFDGPRLVATSERDLFASGLLPTRTPTDVYRAIALQSLPSFVGEDRIADFNYMVAAAPIRTAGRDAILTVPQALRQREIEREIDDLDRGVHLAALVFVLLGAGLGLWMAERIADPVRRLTRATQRIARGDFDARIAVRTSDELRRLVDAFNSMAVELKEQRTQLERTHRLEAWAEMARQVAHEIKNPLTPIQLSAEHLRRVHADRGEPMGPLLDHCVTSILDQVRLLRQISAEFSSFASSPQARPAPVHLPELVREVVEPYRTGLADRIQILNSVTDPLPPAFVDRTLVARALVNVIENALHAMPRTGTLSLDARRDGGGLLLEVRDTGPGMDDDALARVFEPYFSTKSTGTGLGLPIARRNIEASGGTITVESEKGVGTLVKMVLPVLEEEEKERGGEKGRKGER